MAYGAASATAGAGTMVDLAFDVDGRTLAREHRRALAAALLRALPWLAETPGCAVHRLKLPPGEDSEVLLSRRTRLTLRVPRAQAAAAARLDGSTLDVDGRALVLRRPRQHELLPFGTLYAHLVAFAADDELAFLREVEATLRTLGIAARAICGRRQVVEHGTLAGYSLMLDRLAPGDALRLQELGLGAHRELGCGVFVPHKSAAAVGTPP